MKLTVFWLKFHWILLRWIFLQLTVSHTALVYNGLVLKRWPSITRTNDAWTRFMSSYDMHYSGHRLNRSLYAEKKSIRNFELNVQIFFEEYALENVICKLSTILGRAQSICNDLWWHLNVWYLLIIYNHEHSDNTCGLSWGQNCWRPECIIIKIQSILHIQLMSNIEQWFHGINTETWTFFNYHMILHLRYIT